MILSRSQHAISKMVTNHSKHQWTNYDGNDRFAARTALLSRVNKPANKEKKELLTTLANALQDDIWQFL
jgi:hypothetical protein